jgi:UDP-glucose 4-epimerase
MTERTNAKVLVTGGAGFIGSHLVERLLNENHAVRVLDNLSTGKRANLPSHPGLEFIQGDIRDATAVERAVSGVQAIVHLAAVASVQASVDEPLATHGSNFDGTLLLLEAARRFGARRFVYASSAAIYGDTECVPVPESATPNPLTPYAADKLAGEYYLRFYFSKFGLATTAFRFFNIYGPRQDPSSPYSGVISIFCDRLKQDRPVTLFGDGNQTRDFVYVGDLAGILMRSLGRADLNGRVLNVGAGREISLLELLDDLESLSGRPITREHTGARMGDIKRSCADARELAQAFGGVPATTMREGLRKLLDYNEKSV